MLGNSVCGLGTIERSFPEIVMCIFQSMQTAQFTALISVDEITLDWGDEIPPKHVWQASYDAVQTDVVMISQMALTEQLWIRSTNFAVQSLFCIWNINHADTLLNYTILKYLYDTLVINFHL